MCRNYFSATFLLLILGLAISYSLQPNAAFAKSLEVDDVQNLKNYKLRLTLTTSASKQTIWELWSDVENWKQYDELVVYSNLDDGQRFETGATGVVKTSRAPKAKFTLIEVTEGVSFTERLSTPLWQSIDLVRYFEENDAGDTLVVHEVHFKGPLRWLIYAFAGGPFKKELPRVMNKLKEIAEMKPQQHSD